MRPGRSPTRPSGSSGRAATRARLAAVEAEIVALMADDRVPARGRRLRALEQARDDLRAELEEDGAARNARARRIQDVGDTSGFSAPHRPNGRTADDRRANGAQ